MKKETAFPSILLPEYTLDQLLKPNWQKDCVSNFQSFLDELGIKQIEDDQEEAFNQEDNDGDFNRFVSELNSAFLTNQAPYKIKIFGPNKCLIWGRIGNDLFFNVLLNDFEFSIYHYPKSSKKIISWYPDCVGLYSNKSPNFFRLDSLIKIGQMANEFSCFKFYIDTQGKKIAPMFFFHIVQVLFGFNIYVLLQSPQIIKKSALFFTRLAIY